MHFQYDIWEQILLQTTLWLKICSWYFVPLQESITNSWRNTGQSNGQCTERTRINQNERLQRASNRAQRAEPKFDRELESHRNSITRRKAENKARLIQRGMQAQWTLEECSYQSCQPVLISISSHWEKELQHPLEKGLVCFKRFKKGASNLACFYNKR